MVCGGCGSDSRCFFSVFFFFFQAEDGIRDVAVTGVQTCALPISPELTINEPNVWRLTTPGHHSWPRSARPGDPKKYFIVSADAHANEPADLWATRIDAKYRARLPRVIVDEHGVKWRVSEGHRPDRLRTDDLEGEDRLRQLAGADPEQRLRDMDRDGID